jgi:prepilin-type N-terminal cleavage/methylation domain-containing protein/prepilin-type processing-associated H-X9-DG protein
MWYFRQAFTLLELLVAIAIIGCLVAVLMPAVQSARESSRRASCANQIRQITLAALAHHDAQRHFPTGGWGFAWVGDPDRGFGTRQPGGWIYNILPFVEEQSLHDLGRGLPDTAAGKWAEAVKMIQTPVPLFNCPSRRSAAVFAVRPDSVWLDNVNKSEASTGYTRSCYAANAGDQDSPWYDGPVSLAAGDAGIGFDDMSKVTGISCQRSAFRIKDVTDGLSMTYLAGEKYLNSDNYFNGLDASDDAPMLSGAGSDLHADSVDVPMNDRPGESFRFRWGSAHPGIVNMAFADGSVHPLSIEIDLQTHRRLGNRHDGLIVDVDKLGIR